MTTTATAPELHVMAVTPPPLVNTCGHFGTDVTIDVCDKRYNAHRSILDARSSMLMVKLFFGPTMDYDAVAHLRIDDVEPRMLPEIDDGDKAKMAQRLHAAADRYDLQGLKGDL
ncbi:hypothetical protein PR202_ga13333 [Eleusine coracana subsp. coracana]|uniref:BTB domain-containing protein n=1 Tax=Eleusine coracana subsp. coracana TaxID=191504 RepID=A0AAV5CEI5_ELECO|nr:hypothetical protein PR202_ga13333 [Eleusine coracana subsp. coracana]